MPVSKLDAVAVAASSAVFFSWTIDRFSSSLFVPAPNKRNKHPTHNAPVVFFCFVFAYDFLPTFHARRLFQYIDICLLASFRSDSHFVCDVSYIYRQTIKKTSKSRMIVRSREFLSRPTSTAYGHRFSGRMLLAMVSGRPLCARRTERDTERHIRAVPAAVLGTNHPTTPMLAVLR